MSASSVGGQSSISPNTNIPEAPPLSEPATLPGGETVAEITKSTPLSKSSGTNKAEAKAAQVFPQTQSTVGNPTQFKAKPVQQRKADESAQYAKDQILRRRNGVDGGDEYNVDDSEEEDDEFGPDQPNKASGKTAVADENAQPAASASPNETEKTQKQAILIFQPSPKGPSVAKEISKTQTQQKSPTTAQAVKPVLAESKKETQQTKKAAEPKFDFKAMQNALLKAKSKPQEDATVTPPPQKQETPTTAQTVETVLTEPKKETQLPLSEQISEFHTWCEKEADLYEKGAFTKEEALGYESYIKDIMMDVDKYGSKEDKQQWLDSFKELAAKHPKFMEEIGEFQIPTKAAAPEDSKPPAEAAKAPTELETPQPAEKENVETAPKAASPEMPPPPPLESETYNLGFTKIATNLPQEEKARVKAYLMERANNALASGNQEEIQKYKDGFAALMKTPLGHEFIKDPAFRSVRTKFIMPPAKGTAPPPKPASAPVGQAQPALKTPRPPTTPRPATAAAAPARQDLSQNLDYQHYKMRTALENLNSDRRIVLLNGVISNSYNIKQGDKEENNSTKVGDEFARVLNESMSSDLKTLKRLRNILKGETGEELNPKEVKKQMGKIIGSSKNLKQAMADLDQKIKLAEGPAKAPAAATKAQKPVAKAGTARAQPTLKTPRPPTAPAPTPTMKSSAKEIVNFFSSEQIPEDLIGAAFENFRSQWKGKEADFNKKASDMVVELAGRKLTPRQEKFRKQLEAYLNKAFLKKE